MTLKKRLIKEQRVLLAIVIIVIVAAVSAINPRFIQVKNLITIFQQISVTGILTMAMSMLLIGGGIDLSIGNIMILSGVVMASVIHSTGNTARRSRRNGSGNAVRSFKRSNYRQEQMYSAHYYAGNQRDVLRNGLNHFRRQNYEL